MNEIYEKKNDKVHQLCLRDISGFLQDTTTNCFVAHLRGGGRGEIWSNAKNMAGMGPNVPEKDILIYRKSSLRISSVSVEFVQVPLQFFEERWVLL